ncbi:hypothetical protein BU24DRAFT_434247 [Aaosphaeria arxii CBS 175.79]|uniref:BZIP domain-containing protein n=1 Tax=Aaosphaeria arxii CBS 175.79 TaxID=1450172 RepID=A0A6A5XJR4_9PLEO|nr:uncharacterized protein BU24DRAFT_434247 [Aaosphaeria arxii CBS 175.79]KAF2013126.1 hypothetical protein BU24DRAFT_434247 [Aaosphaeria arxii CBS 175.79]
MSGPAVDYPSPASRRASECFSEISTIDSRRGSLASFGSDVETRPQWHLTASDSGNSKSPLANLGFLKNLTEKKTTRDGQPPKRRGPKPDSKPALTRRQELNRQAQRTHRERKEMYIKALEQEVLRLKDTFTSTAQERDAFAQENRRLRELLIAHGISFDVSSTVTHGLPHMGGSSYGDSSAGSVSGGYGPSSNSTGYTSPPTMPTHPRGSISAPGQSASPQQNQSSNAAMDYDQIGIDFVLTLERPCMDHVQYLMVRAHDPENDFISGHALMASCPPASHIATKTKEDYPHQMPDIQMPDLMKLLDLSNRLPLDGEITPIMAWAMILQDQKFHQLTAEDFSVLKGELLAKVRCYGFGAVLEEFEVRDALMTVLTARHSSHEPMG